MVLKPFFRAVPAPFGGLKVYVFKRKEIFVHAGKTETVLIELECEGMMRVLEGVVGKYICSVAQSGVNESHVTGKDFREIEGYIFKDRVASVYLRPDGPEALAGLYFRDLEPETGRYGRCV